MHRALFPVPGFAKGLAVRLAKSRSGKSSIGAKTPGW